VWKGATVISSSEFRLPPNETRSEATSRNGDSTVNLPPIDKSSGRKKKLHSTVADQTRRDTDRPGIAAGTMFAEFRVQERIGAGSMGEVYRATQLGLDRSVALKLLPLKLAYDPTLVERFRRETHTLASLDHPHIVRAISAGESGGWHYAAMEFVDGRPLQDWLDDLGRLTVGDALHVVLVCAAALEHAHNQGVVHRDIKASNVLVSRAGVAKLSDFGLVRLVREDMSMTASGTGLGTPEYMPPEQCEDARSATAQSDIYSLGVMLYVMLTGELPCVGTSLVELLFAKRSGVFKSAKSLNPEVPERADLILQKMLAPEPSHRYANCTELIRDLTTVHRHNESLSFVDVEEADRYVAWGPWCAESRATAEVIAAAGHVAKPVVEPVTPNDRVWYVSHRNKLGKDVLSKMNTADLINALDNRLLPASSQVKRLANERFRSLADHQEFLPALKRLGVKIKPSAATQKKRKLRKKKRRRDRTKERLDLMLRVLVGAAAAYGLVRGIADVGGLFTSDPQEQEQPVDL
jgi:serine/threonine-protein kinase